MINVNKLKQARSAVVSELRALIGVIEERADKQMTPEESTKWNDLNKKVDEMAEEIKRAERMNHLEMENDSAAKETSSSSSSKDENKSFRGFGEFLRAVIKAGRNGAGRSIDPRLEEVRASGLGEEIATDGGFLVGTDYSKELLQSVHDTAIIYPKCRNIPISSASNSLVINGIDETSRASGSRWGGVSASWESEISTGSGSHPKFKQIQIKLKKLKGFCYLTDELLQDSVALESIVRQAFAEEFSFLIDDSILSGVGGQQPLGVLSSKAFVTVSKEGAQAADTILYENINKMWARLWARSRANSAWYINQDCESQLNAMNLVVGAAGVPVYMPAGGISGAPYSTLFGRPVIPIEQCKTVGDLGDVVLADFSQYLVSQKGALQTSSSIHVRFLEDEMVLKFILRIDGQPIWQTPLTPANGTNTLSPFVVLEAR